MNKQISKSEIKQQVKKVMAQVFEIEENSISDEISMKTLEKWDSMDHLRLIMEMETLLEVTFETEQIPKLTSLEIITDIVNNLKK